MIVEIVRHDTGKQYPTAELRKIAGTVLRALKQRRAELSIALVGDREMRELNARYRKKNSTTDVLSFPAQKNLSTGSVLLGDVVISVDQARRQAKDRRRTLKEEMTTLLIHGVLHLLGYDHERSARDAKVMGCLEQKIYRMLCEQGILRV